MDAKTRKILDDYLTERIKKTTTSSTTTNNKEAEKKKEEDEDDDVVEIKQEDKVDLETYTDEDMKYEDNLAKEQIGQILQDNQKEMQSYVPKVIKDVVATCLGMSRDTSNLKPLKIFFVKNTGTFLHSIILNFHNKQLYC